MDDDKKETLYDLVVKHAPPRIQRRAYNRCAILMKLNEINVLRADGWSWKRIYEGLFKEKIIDLNYTMFMYYVNSIIDKQKKEIITPEEKNNPPPVKNEPRICKTDEPRQYGAPPKPGEKPVW